MIIQGRFRNAGTSEIIIRGKAGRAPISIPVKVQIKREQRDNAVLAPLWARAKIDELEKDMIYNGNSPAIRDEITDLGLDYRLVTAYTSFVAVDRSRTVDGELRTRCARSGSQRRWRRDRSGRCGTRPQERPSSQYGCRDRTCNG